MGSPRVRRSAASSSPTEWASQAVETANSSSGGNISATVWATASGISGLPDHSGLLHTAAEEGRHHLQFGAHLLRVVGGQRDEPIERGTVVVGVSTDQVDRDLLDVLRYVGGRAFLRCVLVQGHGSVPSQL